MPLRISGLSIILDLITVMFHSQLGRSSMTLGFHSFGISTFSVYRELIRKRGGEEEGEGQRRLSSSWNLGHDCKII